MFEYGWRANPPEDLKTPDILGNHWQIYLEDFSSRPNIKLGQKNQDLDVTAPGAWIVGPYKPSFSDDVSYYYLSGTSMAAPHVSAISALVLQSYPSLNQSAMETILKNSARGLPLPACDALVAFPFIPEGAYPAAWNGGDWGAGFLQANSALQKAAVKVK
jgi:subtilisin family serine protease